MLDDGKLTKLQALCDAAVPGHALPREFYSDPDVYEADIRDYWNHHWIWVGHVSQVAEPGAFFLFDYGPESIIVVRDREGRLGAFLNVCRHRGSRVCVARSGTARVFSCPYHAWTFELDGRLRRATHMDEDFAPEEHGLFKVHLRVFEGLIFVSTGDEPPELDEGLAGMRDAVAPYRLDRLKIAHEASYPVPANWKLAIENYMECYHCAPAHHDYSRSHSLKDPDSITPELRAAMEAEVEAAGLLPAKFGRDSLAAPVGMDFWLNRYPLYPGYTTGSKDGALLAPLLGNLKAPVAAATDMQIGILNNFLIYSDHVVGYRFVPRGVQQTDIEMVWLVREDAEEGRDYDVGALTWLWHVTTLDDERIIRVNQEGVNSHHFVPGPLSSMEWGIRTFYAGYLDRLRAAATS
ncbi:aromatic ring-hydroxylating dioxygenase subunit alpha [Roseovarius sp. SCSIO 43702]|uniref:aromatic ring-hydroxylating oxygenase subunit alpha n=1 Tax=Roseovarius sp. SCSIO 43702 TaxID=2823043 RepID=UPI001C739A84|nr:aromatic ring-hydroxylating dioxygenase subunit alpha [Roseovarius sp. SCSIO 43702]QYX57527.1 aromatic ring-hydroxylating dioxygenase subunit alpha [Roseovarius sp. SCSIO 43702]